MENLKRNIYAVSTIVTAVAGIITTDNQTDLSAKLTCACFAGAATIYPLIVTLQEHQTKKVIEKNKLEIQKQEFILLQNKQWIQAQEELIQEQQKILLAQEQTLLENGQRGLQLRNNTKHP